MNRSRTQPRVPAKAAIAVAAACGLAAPAPPIAAQSTDPFPAVLDLESLSPPGGDGSLGFVIEGEREYGFAGESVASAGDVNGDGIDDLVIGAPGDYYYPYLPPTYYPMAGRAYLIFGRDSTAGSQFPALVETRLLTGGMGSRLLGSKPGLIAPGLREGETVSSAGDINGDGVDDVIIGSGLEGRAYIVFGRDTASGAVLPVEIELTDLDGSDGFRLVGSGSRIAVALAGDFNGDGVDDVIVSDPFADSTGSGAGTSFIVFGRSAGAPAFPAVLDLSSLDGETGIRIEAGGESESFGGRVAGAGDVNNDGIDDVVISGGGSADHVVRAYVLFGSTARFPPMVAMSSLDGKTGFRLEGRSTTYVSVLDVRSAGDLNNDGIADIVVAAAGPQGERAVVVFGRDTVAGPGFPPAVDLSALDGATGFRLQGMPDRDTFAAAIVGDINGDGIDDLAMNSFDWLGHSSSRDAFVLFGRDAFPPAISVAGLDGAAGFRLTGPRHAGVSLAPAGDVNGDGVDDLIIGAPAWYLASGSGQRGRAYIIFGRRVDTPCYADCDASGGLDFFDFLCFQNRFAAGDPQADCDESGELDFFDFLCFQNAFAAGCP